MSDLKPFENSISTFSNALDLFFRDPFWMGARNILPAGFRIDVRELDEKYLLEADLPGVDKNEIEISMLDGRLTINVSKGSEVEEKDEGFIHRERRFQSMSRTVYLGDAQSEGIRAKLKDGVLRIDIPKIVQEDNTVKIPVD